MKVNLSNVNISINEFQRLSQGDINAGEVKLAGENKLAKMNNHVGSTVLNKEIISHAEVIAIKQALVKALSQNGVAQAEIDRIRQELGLAPKAASDVELRHRSIMPLSRQKIREILDRNAETINEHSRGHGGGVFITTSKTIYGPRGMDAASAAKRDAVNAKLVEYDRRVNVDEDIVRFQAIVSNHADYATREERGKILDMARSQLDALLRSCGADPSDDRPATASIKLRDGQTLELSAGTSEKKFAELLRDLILRFSADPDGPGAENANELEIAAGLLRLDADGREAFWGTLADDPRGGFKARAIAIQALNNRGVTDYATLSLANKLSNDDAIALASAVLAMPKNDDSEAIRENHDIAALLDKAVREPADVAPADKAYVPATRSAADAFRAADGERRATEAGFHPTEMPALAKAFALYKAAAHCTDAEAVAEVLSQGSKARRVLSYGGRFALSPTDFAKGLQLVDRFQAWFENVADDVRNNRRDTVTKLNLHPETSSPRCARGIEKCVFEEIARDPAANLDEPDAERLFGMEHNAAMRFIGGGHVNDETARTLLAVPPEKRRLVYDVFAAIDDPLAKTPQEKAARKTVSPPEILLARILRRHEGLERMKKEGTFDRPHLVETLFRDYDVAADATTADINSAGLRKFMDYNPLQIVPLTFQLALTGAYFDDCVKSLDGGFRIPPAPYVGTSSYNGFQSHDGTSALGLETFRKDINRATGAAFSDGTEVLDAEHVRFVFRFPDADPIVSRPGPDNAPATLEALAAVTGRVEALCGRAHPEQISSVYYALSQFGVSRNIRLGFLAHGITNTEHMAMRFAIERNAETGAVTVHYSEPEGFPFKFHWTTTIALDGTMSSTPMLLENPPMPEPQPAN